MPIWLFALWFYPQTLTVIVRGPDGQPLQDAIVIAAETRASTDASGRATLPAPPAPYQVSATKEGFDTLRRDVNTATAEVEILLPKASKQEITVEAQADAAPESAAGGGVTSEQLRRLPGDPPVLRDALPLIPGIVRSPEGRLTLSGAPEYRSTLLINSLDVTDPGTGRFGATIPIDAVAQLNVYKSPFLAEYGRFTGGVVAVESKRGTEKWHYELNDPTPEMRIRSARIVGVRGFTPRFLVTGPVKKGSLYLSQAVEFAIRKTPNFTLQYPNNEQRAQSLNSLTQVDWLPNASHWVSISAHGVPQKIRWVRPGFYNALDQTPDYAGHEYRGSIVDRYSRGQALLESALSYSEVRAQIWPQGPTAFSILPNRNDGNYFSTQDRLGSRAQWAETYTFAPRGTHRMKAGILYARTALQGFYRANDILIRDFEGTPLSTIGFLNGGRYQVTDHEGSAFFQGHVDAKRGLGFDYGLRTDYQNVTGVARLAPRAAVSWAPFGETGTVFRTGYGWFYDRAPLNVYSYGAYPQRIIDGVLYSNRVGVANNSALVFGASRPGNFAPQSRSWSTTVEHGFPRFLRIRANYLESRSEGLMVLQPEANDIWLRGAGRGLYRQFEFLTRFASRDGEQIMFSYARSLARGNVNEFAEFLGDYPHPLIRPDAYALAAGNIPHRLLAWGVIPVSKSWQIAPVAEYRTGFPWSALDSRQQYLEQPNSRRFPSFFSLDFRVSKDISYKGRRFQVSFSMFNTTNHWNPDTVRWNAGDPQFGEFLGQHRRRYRLDFDFLQ